MLFPARPFARLLGTLPRPYLTRPRGQFIIGSGAVVLWTSQGMMMTASTTNSNKSKYNSFFVKTPPPLLHTPTVVPPCHLQPCHPATPAAPAPTPTSYPRPLLPKGLAIQDVLPRLLTSLLPVLLLVI